LYQQRSRAKANQGVAQGPAKGSGEQRKPVKTV
jgi:hypothetical protein